MNQWEVWSGRASDGPVSSTDADDRSPSADIVTWDASTNSSPASPTASRGAQFDVMLAITRGGSCRRGCWPTVSGIRNILVAAVEYYDDEGQPGPRPTFLQFPADSQLRGQRILVVDEVWDSGTTIHAVTERIRQAGGVPTTVVLTTNRPSVVPGRAGRPCRDDRCLGGLSVQGRAAEEGSDDDQESPTAGRDQEGRVHPRERRSAARLEGARTAVRGWPVHDIIVEPGAARLLVAAGNAWYGPAVWRSEDDGETWTHSSAGLTYGEEAEPIKTIWSLRDDPGRRPACRGRTGRALPQ